MYSPLKLASKYIRYYISASNGKGHGIHSPFVFDLVTKVLNDKNLEQVFHKIEARRKALLADNTEINVVDFGAGSGSVKTNQRKISAIAKSSLKPKKYAQLLFKIVKYFNPEKVVELGTSLGITTAYISSAVPNAEIITCEGDESIALIAEATFKDTGAKNINIIKGSFDKTISQITSNIKQPDLVYIDGNHRKEPTLQYFSEFRKGKDEQQVIIFDDIHWSKEMEEAWELIKANEEVTLTIDLFFIGLVFFKKDFKAKQHFTIRF